MAKKRFETSWKANREEYFLYHRGREISSHTRFHWAGDDILVFYPITNCTYLLRDFESYRDGKMRPAEIISTNAKTTHIIKKGNRFVLLHKGEPYQEETARTFIDHILVIYDKRHKVTRFISSFRNRKEGLLPADSYLSIERSEALLGINHDDSFQIIWRGREISYMLDSHDFGPYRFFFQPKSKTVFIISNSQWRTWKSAAINALSEFDAWVVLSDGQHFFQDNPTLWLHSGGVKYLFHDGNMNPEGVQPQPMGIHGVIYLTDTNRSLILDSFFKSPEDELFQAVDANQYFKNQMAKHIPVAGSRDETEMSGNRRIKKQKVDGNHYFWTRGDDGVQMVYKGNNILDTCKLVRLPWDGLLVYHKPVETTLHLKDVENSRKDYLQTAEIVSQNTPLVVTKTTDKKFRLYCKGESCLHHMTEAELLGNDLIIHFHEMGTARARGFFRCEAETLIPAVFDSQEE